MIRDKADELVRDLERVPGVRIEITEPLPYYPGEWQIVCWSEHTHAFHTITGAKLSREAVHKGLTPVLPKGALDFKG